MTVNRSSGKMFTLKADRIDNFDGEIQLEITGVPDGFYVPSPLTIEAGHYTAEGAVYAFPDAADPPSDAWQQVKITATAKINGQDLTKQIGNLGDVKLAGQPKLLLSLSPKDAEPVPLDAYRAGDGDRNDPRIWASSYGTQLTSFADLAVADIRTTVTDRNGNITEHEFNRLGNHLTIREFTSRNVRASDPAFYETTFEYSADAKRLADRRVEGNSVERIYDEANPLRFQQGNLLQSRWLADSDRAGDQAEILEAFTNEPI